MLDKITPLILWLVFGGVLLAVGLLTWALIYHWRRYRVPTMGFGLARLIYFFGVALLILIALTSLLFYLSRQV